MKFVRDISIVFILLCNYCYAQLNCKTKKDAASNIIKTCYHNNGKISVMEVWDKERRSGRMIGYNNKGKEIINYDLRRFAGHSSVYLEYYNNGQIKKAEYRSAPDGGIQFWHIIHNFDSQGNQTEYYDLSQPDGHPVLMPKFKDSLLRFMNEISLCRGIAERGQS